MGFQTRYNLYVAESNRSYKNNSAKKKIDYFLNKIGKKRSFKSTGQFKINSDFEKINLEGIVDENKEIVLLLGPPASGKGTYGKELGTVSSVGGVMRGLLKEIVGKAEDSHLTSFGYALKIIYGEDILAKIGFLKTLEILKTEDRVVIDGVRTLEDLKLYENIFDKCKYKIIHLTGDLKVFALRASKRARSGDPNGKETEIIEQYMLRYDTENKIFRTKELIKYIKKNLSEHYIVISADRKRDEVCIEIKEKLNVLNVAKTIITTK